MRPIPLVRCLLAAVCLVAGAAATAAEPSEATYLIGRGKADITGPPVGVQMLGYVRPDQISEGIHLRQYARAFVIAEPNGDARLAIVTTELQSVTHSLVLSVLDELHRQFGETYNLANVVIAATHTHAVPGGYWHYGADSPISMPFNKEHFDALTKGIAASIVAAHKDLRPGRIVIGTGEVRGAGAQRSAVAYLNNPEGERRKYNADIDTEMTLLRFEVNGQPVGILNWHAVHPTSMTFHNKLISSDNKGYAAYMFERQQNASDAKRNFVAAFAQSNCGDVTPHLNLKGTGPGDDDFEGTQIIGSRMAEAAARISASAGEELNGPIDSRQSYVDLGNVAVGDEFTHDGPHTTSPPAYGYSFAAGSTEDGGGQSMFREGMTRRLPLIDAAARKFLPLPAPSEAMRKAQRPKPILLATGAADPSATPRVLPIGVARVGQLALVIGPAEFTTMSGRRFRQSVKQALPGVKYVVIAGYAGDYAAYVATREEYEMQHYEGASTLFGPWTQAAYQQEFTRLAEDIAAGRPSSTHAAPREMRGTVKPTPLATPYDDQPPDADFGELVRDVAKSYRRGDCAAATFWSGNPKNAYRPDRFWASVERMEDGNWQPVAHDGDWELKCRWTEPGAKRGSGRKRDDPLAAHQFLVEWEVPETTQPGTYRLAHHGCYKVESDGHVQEFEATSGSFEVE